MSPARSRTAVAAIAALFLIALGTSAAAAHVPALAPTLKWAWVTVRVPEPASPYNPAPRDQGNSTGSTNHVSYTPTGRYRVTLEHVGDLGGMVHVTVLGATTNICEVIGWGDDGPDEVVDVACYTRLGAPTAQRFSLSFLATSATTGRLAYLWANDPAEPDPYAPDPSYSYNSKGGATTVDRTGVGSYLVWLGDLGSMKGHVQVTAYETVTAKPPPTSVAPATAVLPSVCNVGGWGPSGDDMVVLVYCRDSNGVLTDSRFDLTFMQGLGLKGLERERVAYLFGHRPQAASYTPHPNYWFSSADQAPTIVHQAEGNYLVTLPGMPKGGGVQVTAFGSGAKRCVARSIRTEILPQKVRVRCYDFAGETANAKFTLAYER